MTKKLILISDKEMTALLRGIPVENLWIKTIFNLSRWISSYDWWKRGLSQKSNFLKPSKRCAKAAKGWKTTTNSKYQWSVNYNP
jgi:hypothetical protein